MILDSTNVTAMRLFFPLDPCDNFPCKRGKTCKLDADDKPGCVCQEPAECPPSVTEYDHVGTDCLPEPTLIPSSLCTSLNCVRSCCCCCVGLWDRQQNIRHIL